MKGTRRFRSRGVRCNVGKREEEGEKSVGQTTSKDPCKEGGGGYLVPWEGKKKKADG